MFVIMSACSFNHDALTTSAWLYKFYLLITKKAYTSILLTGNRNLDVDKPGCFLFCILPHNPFNFFRFRNRGVFFCSYSIAFIFISILFSVPFLVTQFDIKQRRNVNTIDRVHHSKFLKSVICNPVRQRSLVFMDEPEGSIVQQPIENLLDIITALVAGGGYFSEIYFFRNDCDLAIRDRAQIWQQVL